MPESLEFVNLPLSGPLAAAAAELLLEHVQHGHEPDYVPGSEDIAAYLAGFDSRIEKLYAITGRESGLIAAGTAIHAARRGVTYIGALAVMPEQRGNGYSRRLLEFIGSRAFQAGDTELEVVTGTPEYFSHLGFVEVQDTSREDEDLHVLRVPIVR